MGVKAPQIPISTWLFALLVTWLEISRLNTLSTSPIALVTAPNEVQNPQNIGPHNWVPPQSELYLYSHFDSFRFHHRSLTVHTAQPNCQDSIYSRLLLLGQSLTSLGKSPGVWRSDIVVTWYCHVILEEISKTIGLLPAIRKCECCGIGRLVQWTAPFN